MFLLGFGACASPELDDADLSEQATEPEAIIGGAVDQGDPAVAMLFAHRPGTSSGSMCTATLVSPTVLLTAAHCVSPATVGSGRVFEVFFGTDARRGSAADWKPVKEVHFDPAFNENRLTAGHDIGVAILESPASIAPRAINRTAMTSAMVGQPVRLVGYGVDNAPMGTGAGVKRQVTGALRQVTSNLLAIGDSSHQTCNGDSGGPGFMSIGGQEVIVGITSFGPSDCAGAGWDTRVDAYLSFLDPYLGSSPPPPSCTPVCSGRACGEDGCGGSCGACASGQSCTTAGQCVAEPGSTEPPPPEPGSGCTATGAREVEPNGYANSAGILGCDGTVRGVIGQAGDVDWFTFQIGPNTDYHLRLSQLVKDYNLTLYKIVSGSLARVGSARNPHDTSDRTFARHTSDGGTYYLKIYGVNGAFDASKSYLVTLTLNGGQPTTPPTTTPPPPANGTLDAERQHCLEKLNAYRALHGSPALVMDARLNDFAQAGSQQLMADHIPHQHFRDAINNGTLWSSGFSGSAGENQGDPNGWTPMQVDAAVDQILSLMMGEGPGGGHYENIINTRFRRVGIGLVVDSSNQLYFTNDFSN